MQLGLDNGQVYFEYEACRWPVGNIREECDRRAVDIANYGNKIMLGMSSGVDSQIVLLSFLEQHIPIECVFMYLPGYNEYEYNNLKTLEKAWGFKSQIIDFDPMKIKDELMSEALELDIPPYQIMHKKMLSMLPESYDYLEGVSGPFIPFKKGKPLYFEGYHSYEVSRHRGFNTLNRSGRNILYDRNSEFILSILKDEVMTGYTNCYKFFEDNALQHRGSVLKRIDWWDFYVKPIMYGRYWRSDEIFYFKKYQGPENIEYIMNGPPNKWPENYITVPMDEFIASLNKPIGSVTRYYETKQSTIS
jgi:hypothetical protein